MTFDRKEPEQPPNMWAYVIGEKEVASGKRKAGKGYLEQLINEIRGKL
jgi:hypothetical protein